MREENAPRLANGRYQSAAQKHAEEMTYEERQQLHKLEKKTKEELKLARKEKAPQVRRKEFREYVADIGTMCGDLNGFMVPRDFILIYRLYEKACAGNLDAIKLLLSIEEDKLTATQIENIIKLKIN